MDQILNNSLENVVSCLRDTTEINLVNSEHLTSADIAKIMINRSWKLTKGLKPSAVEEEIYKELGGFLAQYFVSGFLFSPYSKMENIPYPKFDVDALGLSRMIRTRKIMNSKYGHVYQKI